MSEHEHEHEPIDRIRQTLGGEDAPAGDGRGAPVQLKATHDAVQRRQAAIGRWWSERDVQMKGGDREAGVREAAAAGVAGAGGRLPHLDRIQQSFGKHDVSAVRAHVGGAAREASENIGARAYATGNSVAFRESPDLHLAAHEAAHVVQQRGGVQLKGGVGREGDRYEQHADAVADAVVQGRSAEGLLDRYAGGRVGAAAVQREGEPKGEWDRQLNLTKDSFFDLVLANKTAAERWEQQAEGDEPPPAWKVALEVVGGLVLGAALGGVGGALAGKLTEGVKFVTSAAINAAIKLGEDSIKAGASAAIASSGDGKKAALQAYCTSQAFSLLKAAKGARESFVMSAGTFDDQKLTIAQMAEIKKANDQAFGQAQTIQNREMLVGWMSMLAGKTKDAPPESDIEAIDQAGVLRLVVEGKGDKPTKIKQARVDGLNPKLRKQLTGERVGALRKGGKVNGKTRTSGIDLLITTEWRGSRYQVSGATWDRLKAAGKVPSSTTSAYLNSIYFSIFVERSGAYYWADTDMNWSVDFNWGADAGRWFLDNVRNGGLIAADLDNLTLPAVTT